jgi:hypothetical protein
MNEWLAFAMLALIFSFATLIRIRLGPVAPVKFVTLEDKPQGRRPLGRWEHSDDGPTTFSERADDGLITLSDLERCLPAELLFPRPYPHAPHTALVDSRSTAAVPRVLRLRSILRLQPALPGL